MGVKLTPKPVPWGRRKWKATPQEIEAFRRMGNGEDIREGIKPNPAPMVLAPARLDNVSQFPSPVVSRDPFPDYPDLPPFLDRRKAKLQAMQAAA